ncbi:hypothetical protein EV363DRAFT_1450317 [Boletus edulis]|nr:hypothetical protein EV363DRAFT_1450317 [Boletus edulis]
MSVHTLFMTYNLAVPLVCLAGIGQVWMETKGEGRSTLVALEVEEFGSAEEKSVVYDHHLNVCTGQVWVETEGESKGTLVALEVESLAVPRRRVHVGFLLSLENIIVTIKFAWITSRGRDI